MLSASALAQFQMPPPAVVVREARLTELAPSVNVPGTVYSRFDSKLASELPAKIAWIAEVGTRVEEGDTVAESEVAIAEAQPGQAKVAMYITEIRAPFNTVNFRKIAAVGRPATQALQ